jgi:hypothetical protein
LVGVIFPIVLLASIYMWSAMTKFSTMTRFKTLPTDPGLEFTKISNSEYRVGIRGSITFSAPCLAPVDKSEAVVGAKYVTRPGSSFIVFACGPWSQMTLTFYDHKLKKLVESVDYCALSIEQFDDTRPWTDPALFDAYFNPFVSVGSCL